jgi:hypothetical protein
VLRLQAADFSHASKIETLSSIWPIKFKQLKIHLKLSTGRNTFDLSSNQ